MRVLWLTVGMLGLLALLGCSTRTEFFSPVYDACNTVDECVETATLCEELAVDFGGFTYVNAICSLECSTPGSQSPDCPRAFVGRLGGCYPSSVAGGIDDTLVCLEPCDFDGDCQFSCRCLSGQDLCGRGAPCPIEDGDAICVPGPN